MMSAFTKGRWLGRRRKQVIGLTDLGLLAHGASQTEQQRQHLGGSRGGCANMIVKVFNAEVPVGQQVQLSVSISAALVCASKPMCSTSLMGQKYTWHMTGPRLHPSAGVLLPRLALALPARRLDAPGANHQLWNEVDLNQHRATSHSRELTSLRLIRVLLRAWSCSGGTPAADASLSRVPEDRDSLCKASRTALVSLSGRAIALQAAYLPTRFLPPSL